MNDGPTTCGTPTRAGRSPPESPPTTSPATWAPAIRMLDLTYAHLVKGSEAVAVSRLDAYTARNSEGLAREWPT